MLPHVRARLTPIAASLWFSVSLSGCVAILGPSYPSIAEVDDTALPDSIRSVYHDDAGLLTLRLMGRAELWPIELPAAPMEQLYRALVAVHNATDLPGRDTVVTMYRIHAFPQPSVRRIILSWDSSATWAAAWNRGERLTGFERVDELMEQFDLWPEHHRICSAAGCQPPTYSDWIVLRAGRPLNTVALANRFGPLPGVRWAEAGGVFGGGNDIVAEVRGARWRLTYGLAWGDCPAGCAVQRSWAFEIDGRGIVTYQGSWGSPPPRRNGMSSPASWSNQTAGWPSGCAASFYSLFANAPGRLHQPERGERQTSGQVFHLAPFPFPPSRW